MMEEPLSVPPPASAEPSPRFLSLGDGNEVLQVALAPGDSILAGERAFCYRGLGLQSEVHPMDVGAVGRALGWMGVKGDKVVKWTNTGTAPTYVGLAAALPGKIIPVNLAQSGDLLAKPEMFLCSPMSNQVGATKLRIVQETSSPQHTIEMRKITGTGMCYIQAVGAAVQKALGRTETMVVEVGNVAAVSASCKVALRDPVALYREPPNSLGFAVKISGPGTVFIQSTHAGRIARDRTRARAGAGDSSVMKMAAVVVLGFLVFFAMFEVEY